MESPRRTRRDLGREWSPDTDLVGQYLGEVGGTPLLAADEEIALAKRIEAGVYAAELLRAADAGQAPPLDRPRRRDLRAVAEDGRAAKDHMVRANLRLVVSIARKHANRGLPMLDVVQEGNLGLIRAVEKFDFTKGFKFSTYAVWWIRQAIERGLAEQTRTVRLPVYVVEELSKLNRALRKLRLELDREPTTEEISQSCGLPAPRVAELRDVDRSAVSLDTPIGDDGDASVADLIEDVNASRAYDAVEHQGTIAALRALVETLPARQALIVSRRYGLTDGRPRTLQEVAQELGVTRERIRQLEKESLRLLRDPERNRTLAAWAN